MKTTIDWSHYCRQNTAVLSLHNNHVPVVVIMRCIIFPQKEDCCSIGMWLPAMDVTGFEITRCGTGAGSPMHGTCAQHRMAVALPVLYC